jgi:hypothetical protein
MDAAQSVAIRCFDLKDIGVFLELAQRSMMPPALPENQGFLIMDQGIPPISRLLPRLRIIPRQ